GIIYAGASVHTNALFKTSRLGERPPGGRIIMTCHEREPRLTHHLHARLKGEACYFVSYVYSRQSPEYLLMTKFRDEVLIRNRLGRVFIELYYWVSPFLVAHAHEVRWLDSLIKRIAKFGTNRVRTYYSGKKLK
ncbi:MAG: CFI-box-CTERM domain-containing protein, partial [Saprospiraceae bacterium]